MLDYKSFTIRLTDIVSTNIENKDRKNCLKLLRDVKYLIERYWRSPYFNSKLITLLYLLGRKLNHFLYPF